MRKVTKCIDAVMFTEASDMETEIFERAYDRNGDLLQEWEDFDYMVKHFEEILEACGFDDIDILWEGFYSQGDGLSFTGSFDKTRIDFNKLKRLTSDDEIIKIANKLAKSCYDGVAYIGRAGRYVHSGTMYIDTTVDSDYDVECLEEILEHAKELADIFYKSLENEYDNLGSKEAFLDYAINNKLEFDEEGNIL